MFWIFTVWINCSSDLKNFANSRTLVSNFKSFSQSLEQFFLTVGQNNFGNKIPNLGVLLWHNTKKDTVHCRSIVYLLPCCLLKASNEPKWLQTTLLYVSNKPSGVLHFGILSVRIFIYFDHDVTNLAALYSALCSSFGVLET